MDVDHLIGRIRDVFGRDIHLLEWVLRDPVARASGLIANLSDFQRDLLYRYCVLGMPIDEIERWKQEHRPDKTIDELIAEVADDIISSAPVLLDVVRSKKRILRGSKKA